MARRTSQETYDAITSNGLLSKRRLEVYSTVFQHGPLTSAEAFKIMNEANPVANITQSRARFTELREMGVLYEVRERPCKVTGHLAIEWDVTERLPIAPPKRRKVNCDHCGGAGYFYEKDDEQQLSFAAPI